jgi:mannitol-specific phosphotransferase system IIBC component
MGLVMTAPRLLAITGSVAIAAGSFLDWSTWRAFVGGRGVKGIDSDGTLTVVLAAVATVTLLVSARAGVLLGPAIAMIVGAIGAFDYIAHLRDRLPNGTDFLVLGASASIGVGLYVVFAGASLLFTSSVVALRNRSRRSNAEPLAT